MAEAVGGEEEVASARGDERAEERRRARIAERPQRAQLILGERLGG